MRAQWPLPASCLLCPRYNVLHYGSSWRTPVLPLRAGRCLGDCEAKGWLSLSVRTYGQVVLGAFCPSQGRAPKQGVDHQHNHYLGAQQHLLHRAGHGTVGPCERDWRHACKHSSQGPVSGAGAASEWPSSVSHGAQVVSWTGSGSSMALSMHSTPGP